MTKKPFRLYCEDCLTRLEQIPENTFDMIFADPPYMLSNGGGHNMPEWSGCIG